MKIRVKSAIRGIMKVAGLEIHRIPGHVKNRYAWLHSRGIRTILDVGANKGQFAREIRRFLPDAAIYAFEPGRDLFPELEKAGKGIGRFRAFNVALGDHNGIVRLHRSGFSPASSILEMTGLVKEAYPFLGDVRDEEVPIHRLDSSVTEFGIRLDSEVLLKIDVQGYEEPVIAGGMETIAKCGVVLIEVSFRELYKGQMLFDGLYGILRGVGFRFKGIYDVTCHEGNGMPLFGDAVFVR